MPKRAIIPILGLLTCIFKLFVFSLISPTYAQVARTEFFLAGRTATFTTATGAREIAVLFDSRVAASKSEADAIQNEFGDSIQVGSASVSINYVDWTRAKPALRNGASIFFTRGTEAAWAMIAEMAAGSTVPTISAELDCVREGHCVVGIQARPRVQIFLNQAAARRARTEFTTAFKIMASEV